MLNIDHAYLILGLIVVVMYFCFSNPLPQKEVSQIKKEEKKNNLAYQIWQDYKQQIKESNNLEELSEIQDNIDLYYYSTSVDDMTARPFYNSLGLEITIRKRQLKDRRFS